MNSLSKNTEVNVQPDHFCINDLNDEIRVDQLCQKLLKNFHQHLLDSGYFSPLEAGSMAAGADYFLRDYVIDSMRSNIFHITARQVRGFAGNWYVHRNLEPNMKELEVMLKGVQEFYCYCADNRWVDTTVSNEIAAICCAVDYFRERIESFHALTGDDYPGWCEQCPTN